MLQTVGALVCTQWYGLPNLVRSVRVIPTKHVHPRCKELQTACTTGERGQDVVKTREQEAQFLSSVPYYESLKIVYMHAREL